MDNIGKMIAETNALMARINIRFEPQQNMPEPQQSMPIPPKSRFPYHHSDLNFQILDVEEERIFTEILSMDYEDLVKVNEEIQLAFKLDYPETSQHWHSVKVRAVALRISQLKIAGKLQPKASLGDIIMGAMAGSILADEFWKRQRR